MMKKIRVLYVVQEFPQISETYIKSEIEAIQNECEVLVVSMVPADVRYRNHAPFRCLDDPTVIRQVVDEFQPDILHSHWLHHARLLGYLSGFFAGPNPEPARYIPFTIRAHSFDVLGSEGRYIRDAVPLLNSDLCLGVLNFPFNRPLLERAGVRSEKVVDCYPVVHYRRFYDRSPNGPGVMNIGACLPKKQMDDFLELAQRVPGRPFNLYAMGYRVDEMAKQNERLGSPVTVMPPVEPEEMPAEYKKHSWLVYTASRELGTVGWPIAVAEAQAAGVGVCMPDLRPDIREYVGAAGFLYDSVSQAAEIISRPFPEELRELGFEQARKSDIFEHRAMLLDRWRRAVASGTARPSPEDRKGTPAWGDGGSTWEWQQHLHQAKRDLAALLPPDAAFILVDEDQWRREFTNGRQIFPFTEQGGQYWGPPADDEAGVRELERLRGQGARYMVFARPAFWWLDQYAGLQQYLRSHFDSRLENDRLVVFDLKPRQ